MIIMEPVVSSNVSAVGYDGKSKKLRVEFLNGMVYDYDNVPEAEYQDLLNAGSVGKQFNAAIRNNYSYTQI